MERTFYDDYMSYMRESNDIILLWCFPNVNKDRQNFTDEVLVALVAEMIKSLAPSCYRKKDLMSFHRWYFKAKLRVISISSAVKRVMQFTVSEATCNFFGKFLQRKMSLHPPPPKLLLIFWEKALSPVPHLGAKKKRNFSSFFLPSRRITLLWAFFN